MGRFTVKVADIVDDGLLAVADAVVCPANPMMKFGSGACGAIFKKAGVAVLEAYGNAYNPRIWYTIRKSNSTAHRTAFSASFAISSFVKLYFTALTYYKIHSKPIEFDFLMVTLRYYLRSGRKALELQEL